MQSNICRKIRPFFNKTYSTDQKLADRFRSNFQNMMHSCEGWFHRGKIWVLQHKLLSHTPKNLKSYGVSRQNFVSQSRWVPLLWSTGNVQADRSQKLSKGYAPHTYKHTHTYIHVHTRVRVHVHMHAHTHIYMNNIFLIILQSTFQNEMWEVRNLQIGTWTRQMCFLSLLQTFPRVLELVIKGIPLNSSRNRNFFSSEDSEKFLSPRMSVVEDLDLKRSQYRVNTESVRGQ